MRRGGSASGPHPGARLRLILYVELARRGKPIVLLLLDASDCALTLRLRNVWTQHLAAPRPRDGEVLADDELSARE